MDLINDFYYFITALDHNLSIHAEDRTIEELTISFVGKLIDQNEYYYVFALLEYSFDNRPDLFYCVKSAIKDIKKVNFE